VEGNFKPKLVRRDKEVHDILIRGTVCHEELTIINIYAWCTQCHKKKKTQGRIKGHIGLEKITVCYVNTPPSNR
jgi:hypothetical protein